MADPIQVLRIIVADWGRGGRRWEISMADAEEALAQVEALVEAARGISECGDYWDWVTGYAPKLGAALAPFKENP
jgi:hypothetical protein